MRVLSFIPAFVLAAASFVAAAPTNSPVDTSCLIPTGTGNDAPVQPVIVILNNATTFIQPYSGQLSGLQGDACTPDAVSDILVEVTAIVSTCVSQIQALGDIDCTGLDLTNLCAAIFALLNLVLVILNTLVTVVLTLGLSAVATIVAVISNLLNAVLGLVACLQVFIDAALAGVLGPVLVLVCSVVDLLLSIVVKLGVN
ncbi:hypothetical protein HD554DRAFT_2080009 [Boletus coccyginus]|nr:hypothetical protein HD554DRAFT_2080009 [Boletus coccyginus]